MENALKRKGNLVACVLILIVVCLGVVFADDVVVKEGDVEVRDLDASGDITVAGKVGIGTSSPSHELDVNGVVDVTGDITATGTGTFGKGICDITDTEALLVRKDGDAGDVFVVDTTNGRVCIGENPLTDFTLNVDGDIRADNYAAPDVATLILARGNSAGTIRSAVSNIGTGDVSVAWAMDGITRWAAWVDRSDSFAFGIGKFWQAGGGTTSLKIAYDPAGEVYMPYVYNDAIAQPRRDLFIRNDGQLGYVSSSIRYKKNIRDLTGSERIHQLRPVKFDAKDNSAFNETGLIAEEVEMVMPELVSYKLEEIPHIEEDGNEVTIIGFRETNIPETVNYSELTVPMLKEIQVLKIEVQILKDELCSKDSSYSWCK